MTSEYCVRFPNSARCKKQNIYQEFYKSANNFQNTFETEISTPYSNVDIFDNTPVSAPTPRRNITDVQMTKAFYGPVKPTSRRNITDIPHEEIVVKKYQNKKQNRINNSFEPKTKPKMKYKKEKRKNAGMIGTTAEPIKASHTELTNDEIMKAKMLEAGKIAEIESKTTNLDMILDDQTYQQRVQRGIFKAQEYLDEQGIKWTINPELSNREGLIITENATGISKAVYRGTNFKNVQDLQADLAILHGTEGQTQGIKTGKAQLERANEILPTPVEELLGFSLGGNRSITLGQELGIPTTTFNPAVSLTNIKNVPIGGDLHTIIRTTENPTDILAGFKPNAFKIKSILPLEETSWLNPASGSTVHDLVNFSKTGARRSNNLELLHNDFQNASKLHGELVGIHDAKIAVDNGLTLTEWLENFSPADVADGILSPRVREDTLIYKMWEKAGGDTTMNEAENVFENSGNALIENPDLVEQEFMYNDDTIQDFIDKPIGVRDNEIQGKAQELMDQHLIIEEAGGVQIATRNAFKAAASPTNLGLGIIGGIAGEKLTNMIDPDEKLGEIGHVGVSGALGGGITAGAGAVLGGEALAASVFAPAIVGGGAGALAGYETNKAVANSLERAGANRDTVESISSISGGAVGGATASAVGIGTAALIGAEVGELGGPLGVALGAGVGAVFGLGSYAIDSIKYNSKKEKHKRSEARKQERIATFGYDTEDPRATKPLNETERLARAEQFESQAIMEMQNRQFEMNDPYALYQARRRSEFSGTHNMGGALEPNYQTGDRVVNPYSSQQSIDNAQQQTQIEERYSQQNNPE
tara:strand:+ start:267 stop:2717 length:2451 start_codon:yes stop_codon:yes gene_type:complete